MSESKKRIALLSNITADLIAGKLRKIYDIYLPEGFDTWVQEVINPSSGLYGFAADAVIVLLDGTEARAWKDIAEANERISTWKQAIAFLTENISGIPMFISTVDFRENKIKSLSERKYHYEYENDWYQFVQGLIEEKKNIFLLDLLDTILEFGRKQFYSNKMWYMSNMPYSRDGLNALVCEIERVLGSAFIARKKIVALDLDNTLWGGVVGEDGIEGIELSDHKEGQRFFDFQRQLLEMKNRGIVLGINSKNNEKDAEEVIQKHPAMLLRDDSFVSRKINWENKAVNIKAMEDELNLTEGGFIFVDDNPVERETVKGECPDVLVPDFPLDTSELLPFAEEIWFNACRPLRVLGEDLKKTQMYQNEARRKQDQETSLNLDDYIKKLEIVVDIHRMQSSELERVVQLINKTNQFNVTTKRYTQTDIEEIVSNPNNYIYTVHSADKYGDNGLISVIILRRNGEIFDIDTFLMSCRVMGRKLEDVIINELASRYSGIIRGEYIPTAKNAPVRELFDKLGFKLVSENNGKKQYELNTIDYIKKPFETYNSIRFED